MSNKLADLQKIILDKRVEPLSSMEVRNLFSYSITPEFILYLLTAFNMKKLDPNIALIQSIAHAKGKEDLIPIALSLRYGADPNLYVNAPTIGDIHILGYTYLILSRVDTPVLNGVVIMLMIMGSNPEMLIFDNKGGAIKDEFSLIEPLRGQSVIDWLDDQGYTSIIPKIQKNFNKVDKKFLTTLSTFLDNEKLIKVNVNSDEIIGAHSNILFNKYKNEINPDQGLRLGVKYLNLTAFEYFIDQGTSLGYNDINNLINSMKKYQSSGDNISLSQIRQMLLYSIARGQTLDTFQANTIKNINEGIYKEIVKEYSVPYWKKICIPSGSAPERFKTLAYQLNLNPETPKGILCNRIRKILQSDPAKVKQSVVDRQRNRVHTIISHINEYDNGPVAISCSNRSVLKGNIYDYPDTDIAFYRDDNDDLWCFTSNNFLKILEQKKNPYTNQEFPSEFLDSVRSQVDYISRYRDINENPTPISDVLDQINQNDQITNTQSDNEIRLFKKLLNENGLTDWNLSKLSIDQMETILVNNFGIKTTLNDSNKEDALRTFMIISQQYLDSDRVDKFFKDIENSSVKRKENKSNNPIDFGLNTGINTGLPPVESKQNFNQGSSKFNLDKLDTELNLETPFQNLKSPVDLDDELNVEYPFQDDTLNDFEML